MVVVVGGGGNGRRRPAEAESGIIRQDPLSPPPHVRGFPLSSELKSIWLGGFRGHGFRRQRRSGSPLWEVAKAQSLNR